MEAQEEAPLTIQQALTRMLTLLQQEDLIKRFGALRPSQQIQKVMTTDTDKPSAVIPWRITLALANPHSTEMKGLRHQLSHSGLLNPAAACYMNSVVTGLVWSAKGADGLSEDHWSNFPGVFETIADVSQGGEPLLLWADGQWTTFLSTWPEPFRQHDVTDFAHYLLHSVVVGNPGWNRMGKSVWWIRVPWDAPCIFTSAVSKRMHCCPLICKGISNWSLASFGLHGLTEPADVTCLHIDRFDSRGKKSRTRLSCDSKVWMPFFFFNPQLGIDHIPFEVTAVSYHLGSEPTCGHYCTAVLEGGFWWIFDDGSPPEKFEKIPKVVQENSAVSFCRTGGRSQSPS